MIFNYKIILKWLLGVFVHLVLIQSAVELQKSKNVVVLSGLRSDKQSSAHGDGVLAKRVVLFIVSGLRVDALNSMVNKSASTWDLKNRVGVSTLARSSKAADPVLRMKEIATGIEGVALDDDVESLFSNTKSVFIGPPSLAAAAYGAECHSFDADWENQTVFPFPRELNMWICNRAQEVIRRTSTASKPLNSAIYDKNFYLVYFPGIEVASRLGGPLSAYALGELSFCTDCVKKIYYKMQEAFQDAKTTYIFMSDYNFPSHRSVTWEEHLQRDVPLIIWGSGFFTIYKPDSQVFIRKVRNHDIAPLVSAIIGERIPAHSLGRVPLDYLVEYSTKSKIALSNAKQLSELWIHIEKSLGYSWSNHFSSVSSHDLATNMDKAQRLINYLDYGSSIDASEKTMELAWFGIMFYMDFNANHICAALFLSLLGWTLTTYCWVLSRVKLFPVIEMELYPQNQQRGEALPPTSFFRKLLQPLVAVEITCAIIFTAITAGLLKSDIPRSIIPSSVLLLLVLWLTISNVQEWLRLRKLHSEVPYNSSKGKIALHVLFFIVWAMTMDYKIISSFGVLLAVVFSSLTDLRRKPKPYLTYWTLSSLPAITLFHLNGAELHFPLFLMFFTSGLLFGIVVTFHSKADIRDYVLLIICEVLNVISAINSWFGAIPVVDSLILWAPAIALLMIPIVGASKIPLRLLEVFLCLCIYFIRFRMESVLFALFFIVNHLSAWLVIEGFEDVADFVESTVDFPKRSEHVTWADCRITFYYLGYVFVAFIASGIPLNADLWPKTELSFLSTRFDPMILTMTWFFPVILLINMLDRVACRKLSSYHIELKMLISACLALARLVFLQTDPSTVVVHLLLFCSHLAEPVSIVLLTPSLISKLRETRVVINPQVIRSYEKNNKETSI